MMLILIIIYTSMLTTLGHCFSQMYTLSVHCILYGCFERSLLQNHSSVLLSAELLAGCLYRSWIDRCAWMFEEPLKRRLRISSDKQSLNECIIKQPATVNQTVPLSQCHNLWLIVRVVCRITEIISVKSTLSTASIFHRSAGTEFEVRFGVGWISAMRTCSKSLTENKFGFYLNRRKFREYIREFQGKFQGKLKLVWRSNVVLTPTFGLNFCFCRFWRWKSEPKQD